MFHSDWVYRSEQRYKGCCSLWDVTDTLKPFRVWNSVVASSTHWLHHHMIKSYLGFRHPIIFPFYKIPFTIMLLCSNRVLWMNSDFKNLFLVWKNLWNRESYLDGNSQYWLLLFLLRSWICFSISVTWQVHCTISCCVLKPLKTLLSIGLINI